MGTPAGNWTIVRDLAGESAPYSEVVTAVHGGANYAGSASAGAPPGGGSV
ncbi:hypothetical protein GCM10010441_03290 [Kitasatospora paracochleata]